MLANDDLQNARLADVSLDIGVHEIVAIEGSSGASRSALATEFSGLLRRDHGDTLVDGEPLGDQRTFGRRLRVGLCRVDRSAL